MSKKIVFISLFAMLTVRALAQSNSLSFDGSDDNVNCGTINLSGNQITLEAWVKVDNFQTNYPYISQLFGTEETDNFALFRLGDYDIPEGNKIEFVLYMGFHIWGDLYYYIFQLTSVSVLETDKWYHIAGIYDGSSVKIYINGVLDASAILDEVGNPIQSSSAFYCGAAQGNTRFFDGSLDEVRVWNDARSEAEIRQNMYRELPDPGSESNLVLYYKFNETSGTTAEDSKGSADGTLVNYNSQSPWEASAAFFGPKNCLHFHGSSDNVYFSSFGPTLTSGTIEFWVFPDLMPTTNARLISKGATYSGGDEIYLIADDGRLSTVSFVVGNDLISKSPIPAGLWTHIAITADNTGSKLYINGILDDTGGAADFNFNSFRIGGQYLASAWAAFDGKMDEVRVWNNVRTESEIRENMMKNLTGHESGLVAYYNFENISGITVLDFSGNGNNGVTNYMDNSEWVSSTAFNTWLNTTSTDWNSAANWSNGVPASGANVGIYNFTNEPDIPASQTFNNLYLGSGITTTLSSSMTVNGSLILDKNLDLNGQTITLGNSAYLIENNGNIFGSAGQIQTTRNLSSINENIAGLGATITEDGDLGSTTIIRTHSPGGSDGINRKFQITSTNEPTDAALVFNYLDSELNGVTEDNLQLYSSADGTTWNEQSAALDLNTNTLMLTGINSFSYFTAGLSGSGAALPVELTLFTANINENKVTLTWQTATEVNNYGFEVERTSPHPSPYQGEGVPIDRDGRGWEKVGFVAGHGNSNSTKEYSFSDDISQLLSHNPNLTLPKELALSYRLKQIDNDGSFSYSDEINVETLHATSLPTEYALYQNYPNPFNPVTTIKYSIPLKVNSETSNTKLLIFDILGNEVATLVNENRAPGFYEVQFDANKYGLSSGAYFYKLQTDGFTSVKKLLLMK